MSIAKGAAGEAAAAQYLLEKGCEILARNYHCRYGELDIVVREPDGTVVFVEVKARKGDRFAAAAAGVTAKKQERLRKTASLYIAEKGLDAAYCRFDVLEIYTDFNKLHRIHSIENAF